MCLALAATAQNVVVEYIVQENRNNAVSSIETKYLLVIKGFESLYYNPVADKSQFRYGQQAEEVQGSEGASVKFKDNSISEIKKEVFYKSYSGDSIIYNDLVVNRRVVVSEPINLMTWTITPQSDSIILGYKCQRATTQFRGRSYEAFFSSSLNTFGGPWKLDGLPGLIVAARSLDNYFVLTPVKIVINDKSHQVVNPYARQKEILDWKSFVTQFENKLRQILKMMKSDGGEGTIRIVDRIEDLGIKELK